MELSVTLNQEEVKNIILEHMLTKFKEVKDVRIEVGYVASGYGPHESTVPGFKGVTCSVEL